MKLLELTKWLLDECDASRKRFFEMRELDATPLFLKKLNRIRMMYTNTS